MEKHKNCASVADMKCVGSCGCVGYAYVPVQEIDDLMDISRAARCGTIFPELELSIDEYGKICKQWGCSEDE